MVKVCHMTSAHPRYDTRIFQKECTSLAGNGYEVYLVVNDGLDSENKDGVNIVSTGYVPKNRKDRMKNGTKAVYETAVKLDADIYHFHDPELLPKGLKLKNMGKKVIFDSHEIYYYQIQYKYYIPVFLRKLIANCYKYYERNVVSKIDAVIVPSTLRGENFFKDVAKKTTLINNVPKKSSIQKVDYKEKSLPISCCMLGSLSISRGLKETLVASKNTDVKLILAGDDSKLSGEGKTFFYKQLKENKLLEYWGYVDRNKVNEIYQESHIGISLLYNLGQYNLSDNLPTKVYEYMLAGIPVVVSKQRYSEEFFNKYPAGILVDVENQKEIDDAICYLRDHPKEAAEMGELGHKIVSEKYCWEEESKKLLDLYLDLSGES